MRLADKAEGVSEGAFPQVRKSRRTSYAQALVVGGPARRGR